MGVAREEEGGTAQALPVLADEGVEAGVDRYDGVRLDVVDAEHRRP